MRTKTVKNNRVAFIHLELEGSVNQQRDELVTVLIVIKEDVLNIPNRAAETRCFLEFCLTVNEIFGDFEVQIGQKKNNFKTSPLAFRALQCWPMFDDHHSCTIISPSVPCLFNNAKNALQSDYFVMAWSVVVALTSC